MSDLRPAAVRGGGVPPVGHKQTKDNSWHQVTLSSWMVHSQIPLPSRISKKGVWATTTFKKKKKNGAQHRNEETDGGHSVRKTKLQITAGWWRAGQSQWGQDSSTSVSPPLSPTSPSQWCLCGSSRCSLPRSCCVTPRRGAPAPSTRWTVRIGAPRSAAGARSAARAQSWTTAAVVRCARPPAGSTATAPCRACTAWSADPGCSASSTRTRTTLETNMGFVKVRARWCCSCQPWPSWGNYNAPHPVF